MALESAKALGTLKTVVHCLPQTQSYLAGEKVGSSLRREA